jgi:hypothetical protein
VRQSPLSTYELTPLIANRYLPRTYPFTYVHDVHQIKEHLILRLDKIAGSFLHQHVMDMKLHQYLELGDGGVGYRVTTNLETSGSPRSRTRARLSSVRLRPGGARNGRSIANRGGWEGAVYMYTTFLTT